MFRLDLERLVLSFTPDDRDLAFAFADMEGYAPCRWTTNVPLTSLSEVSQVAPGVFGCKVTRKRGQKTVPTLHLQAMVE